jgi:hypothetical protein
MTKRKLNGWQLRKAETLVDYNFVIKYQTDKSRMPIGEDSENDKNNDKSGEGYILTLYNKLRINVVCFLKKKVLHE